MRIWNIVSYHGRSMGLCLAFSAAALAEPVPFAQVPPAVQKGIQAQQSGGTLGAIERDEEEGAVIYAVEITKGGRTRDVTFNEAGAVVSMEVFLQEAPLPVQRAIQTVIGQGALQSIDKSTEEGQTQYDVDWKTKEGAIHSMTVLENGTLESIQIELAEAPPAVQAAITAEAGKGQVKEVFKSTEDNEVFYDVSVNRDGKDREFTVASNGKLDTRQVFLEELSPAAQTTIQARLGKAKLVRIDQTFEKKKGVIPLEVEGVVDGKPYDFSVGPNGRFLGVD